MEKVNSQAWWGLLQISLLKKRHGAVYGSLWFYHSLHLTKEATACGLYSTSQQRAAHGPSVPTHVILYSRERGLILKLEGTSQLLSSQHSECSLWRKYGPDFTKVLQQAQLKLEQWGTSLVVQWFGPPSNAGDMGSIPGWRTKIPHASGQLSPQVTTARAHIPTPHATTKTQCRQK